MCGAINSWALKHLWKQIALSLCRISAVKRNRIKEINFISRARNWKELLFSFLFRFPRQSHYKRCIRFLVSLVFLLPLLLFPPWAKYKNAWKVFTINLFGIGKCSRNNFFLTQFSKNNKTKQTISERKTVSRCFFFLGRSDYCSWCRQSLPASQLIDLLMWW